MTEPALIKANKLTKFYGKSKGIENVTFEVKKGDIYALLGPNGAGKTTTIGILLDYIPKSSGDVQIFGLDPHQHVTEIQARTAYLPRELALNENKTVRKNLNSVLKSHKKPVSNQRIEELANRLDLILDRKVKELSKRNKQKIGIVFTLSPEAELLIVDDPTSGLDPFVTNEYYKILRELQEQADTTILLSSHLLDEVEKVADCVGIIREGTVIKSESVKELKKITFKHVKVEFSSVLGLQKFHSKVPSKTVENLSINGNGASFLVASEHLDVIVDALNQAGKMIDLNIQSPDLEKIITKYYKASAFDEFSIKSNIN
ncbi:MAG: ABC transporter ATP-binding protein [Candidatus Lokiarchaeota archaeon]|nr:ABC transporter ATP-binding protein [Candidatus Lokiarchaeota archaeon]